MRRLNAAVIAVILATLLAAPVSASGPTCNPPAELAALQFRQMLAVLNVVALKCQGAGFDYAGAYNAFVVRSRPALEENAIQLSALFDRMGRGPDYIDHYATELFNQVQRGGQPTADFCRDGATLMVRVGATKTADLAALASDTIGPPFGGRACQIHWAADDPR